MIFVDTGAWFAALVPDDADHRAAAEFTRANKEPLVTTDFVLDELLTLLKTRGHLARAESFIKRVLEGKAARLERIGEDDFNRAWLVFRRQREEPWSFTDCASLVLMQRLGIKTAFAFDNHFRQFGTVTVVP